MKKKGIAVAVAAIAVLVAATAVLMMYKPEKPEDLSEVEHFNVLELSDAQSISVKSDTLDIHFVNNNGEWGIEGVDQDEISSLRVSTFLTAAMSYDTETILEGSDSEYGLDNPRLVLTISADGQTHTVSVGDKSPVDSVYFAKADDTKFTLGEYQYASLINELSYYTEVVRFAVNADDITGIKIEKTDLTVDIYLPELTRPEGNVWKMREPITAMASDAFMDENVLEQVASLTMSKKAERLGNVRATLTVTASDRQYVFEIGDTDGGSVYIGYDGGVYSESAELVSFIDADLFSMVNKLVSYVNIMDVSELTTEYDGTVHTISISGENGSLSFDADGKNADAKKSQKLYQTVIGAVASAFYNDEPLGETVLKVTFKGRDGAEDTVAEYKAVNEYTAAAVVNGTTLFTLSMNEINNIKLSLNQYFEEEK